MKTILVTGAKGFIGKNLIEALARVDEINIIEYDIHHSTSQLKAYLRDADLIYHLAGINRPKKINEFETGNIDLTQNIVNILKNEGKRTPMVFSSSIQAGLDNPYGSSKKKAEDILIAYNQEFQAKVYIYRLPNVFGKWSRPNYNSAVATFCHNISRGLDIYISDIHNQVELVYIDDVVNAFLTCLSDPSPGLEKTHFTVEKKFRITLGELVDKIHQLHAIRETLILPDLSDEFMRNFRIN